MPHSRVYILAVNRVFAKLVFLVHLLCSGFLLLIDLWIRGEANRDRLYHP